MSYNTYPFPAKAYLKKASVQVRSNREALREQTQHLVDEAEGPFMEVAGPSSQGFITLEGVKFSQKLATTNYFRNHEVANRYDVDVQSDVRHLPVAAKSLGGVIVSYLTKTPIDIEVLSSKKWVWADHARLYRTDSVMAQVLNDTARGDYSAWSDENSMEEYQRLGLLKETRRTLLQNGLYLMRGATEVELEIAPLLGFELVGSVLRYDGDYPDERQHEDLGIKIGHYGSTENLFRLSDLSTPAGKYIENC